jgi:CDP-4-dehydro-6-deoxyglucose reductase
MAYQITVEPSGKVFSARPGETVLAAATRQGLILPYGCRNGICGACKGAVVAGEVRYDAGQLPKALSEDERAMGQALFCSAVPQSDLVIRAAVVESVADIAVRTLPCRVQAMEPLAPDVMGLELKLPKGERLQYLAGQYLEFLLKGGRRRAFSIANAPHRDETLELHVRHVPGGYFTDFVFGELKPKAMLRIRAPLGTFFLREESDRPIVLVGGGTGFAPLKAMIEQALFTGSTRPMHLFWGVRARRDLYLSPLPEQWARDHAWFRYTPVLSEPRPEDDWTGATGFVHAAVVDRYPRLDDFELYMSGPPPMIEAGRTAFVEHGLGPDRLFFDSFEYGAEMDLASAS